MIGGNLVERGLIGPRVVGGAWTAGTTWTLPAVTLGGAITGGSQNISALGTVGCGAITSTGLLTADVAGVALSLANTTDAASNLVARWDGGNRVTAADEDEAYLSLRLDDSGGSQQEFVRMTWVASDVTNAEMDGYFTFDTLRNSALVQMLAAGFDLNSQGFLTYGSSAYDNNHTWYTNAGGVMTLDGGTGLLAIPGACTTPSYQQFTEMAAPGAGAANTARIYAVVDGGSLTDLAAVFQDGTVDIFAQETTPLDSPIFTEADETEIKMVQLKPHPGIIQFAVKYPNGKTHILKEIQYHNEDKINANKGAKASLPLDWEVETTVQMDARLAKFEQDRLDAIEAAKVLPQAEEKK